MVPVSRGRATTVNDHTHLSVNINIDTLFSRSRLSILPVEHLGDLIDTHKSYLPLEQIQLKRASEMADPSQAEVQIDKHVHTL